MYNIVSVRENAFHLAVAEVKKHPITVRLKILSSIPIPIGSTSGPQGGYGVSDLLLTVSSDALTIYNQNTTIEKWSTPFSIFVPKSSY